MSKPCQYGTLSKCGHPSTTERLKPNGDGTWDVCERHAAFLDRLRANIIEHAEMLRKLADR